MKPDQAAKVLRAHQDWRKGGDGPLIDIALLTQALDAAVAALEVAAVPVFWYRPHRNGMGYDGPVSDEIIEQSRKKSGVWVPLYAAPQPAYCCAKCGLAEMHPRERALHQDAKRGNFRQEDDGA